MIPIIYEPNATTFTSNGRGGLSDAISCTVTEERNGAYELEMVYPLDGVHFEEIRTGAVIKAYCGKARQFQPFRVYMIGRPIGGQVTVRAQHISYQLSLIPCGPFTAGTAAGALAGLKTNAAESCPFEFWTDKATQATYTQTVPASIRSRLGGVRGSILDTYGGEFEFDGYTVRLWNQRGQNRHVVIRYGKNLTDLKQEESIANTVTGVYPFYASDAGYVELPEKVVSAASADNYPYPRTIPLDMTQDFETVPTVAQLRAAAEQYVAGASIGVPSVSLSLSFANLADTLEYADTAAEQVELCDTVGVIFERLGVETSAKVVKTVWNVLAERYNALEVGDTRTTLAQTIAATEEKAAEAVTTTALDKDIKRATDLLTGVNGGFIVWHTNADGKPYELLIMDEEDEAQAQSVWRFNEAGWGHSSTGIGGPYTMAATIGGGIVADYITAGTLTGLTINNGNQTFYVDTAGNVTANSLTSTNATITGGSVSIQADTDTATPLSVQGSYTYITGNYTNYVEYKAEVTRRGLIVTQDTWRYLTSGTRTQYPTTRQQTTYRGSGASVLTYTGNGSAEPTQSGVSTSIGETDIRVIGGTSTTSPRVVMGSILGGMGIYNTHGGIRPRFALNENGLYFYDSNGNLTKSYTA